MTRRLLIAGGGTGGHVLAGVAVADEFRNQFGENAAVLFVGAHGGIEEKLVPRAGYPLHLLGVGKLVGLTLKEKLLTLVKIPLSMLRSLRILIEFRPHVVLGVGGYASGPFVLVAATLGRLFGVRSAVLEQNSVPGVTNRILGAVAQQVFVAFPGAEQSFGRSDVIVTGNPTRSSIRAMPSASRTPFVIFIFGGSQGAMGINTLVLQALSHLSELKDQIRFIHQTGERDYDRVVQGYAAAGWSAKIEKFIYEMPECYAAASLLICRAGASTLSEIAAVGRASILIPLPTAAANHQEVNARAFERAGASWVLLQSQGGERLAELIRSAAQGAKTVGALEARENAARSLDYPNSAAKILKHLFGGAEK